MSELTAVRPPHDTPDAKLADGETYRALLAAEVPDLRTGAEQFVKRMEAPGEVWRFSDNPLAVCRVVVSALYTHTEVVALLPTNVPFAVLQSLLRACLIEALRAFPEAGPWTVGGTFEPGPSGELKALTWQSAVPGTKVAQDKNRRWVITMPTLSRLVAVVELWA